MSIEVVKAKEILSIMQKLNKSLMMKENTAKV